MNGYTDFKGSRPSAVLLNFTSWRKFKDQTVVVEADEHIWFKGKSVVAYDRAEIIEEWRMAHLIRLGKREAKASADLLKKVQDGLEASTAVAPKILKFYKS